MHEQNEEESKGKDMLVPEDRSIHLHYSKHVNYSSLRKTLRQGVTNRADLFIKNVACNCSHHKDRRRKLLVGRAENGVTIKGCQFLKVSTGPQAVTSEGKLLIAYYRFYSKHPDWRVRAAVVVGLKHVTQEASLELLEQLIQDRHFSVALAVVQQLEVMCNEESASVLLRCSRQDYAVSKRMALVAQKAINRIKSYNGIEHTFRRLSHRLNQKNKSRILCQRRTEFNKIYKIETGKNSREIKKITWPELIDTFQLAMGIMIQVNWNGKRLRCSTDRCSKQKTALRKKYFRLNLLSQVMRKGNIKPMPIVKRPQFGEIYWVVTEEEDRKRTRPMLIIDCIQGGGEFLVLPLTTTKNRFVTTTNTVPIKLQGRESYIQIFRQQTIGKWQILDKYGVIPPDKMPAILEKIKAVDKCDSKEGALSQYMPNKRNRKWSSRKPRRAYFNGKVDIYTEKELQATIPRLCGPLSLFSLPERSDVRDPQPAIEGEGIQSYFFPT